MSQTAPAQKKPSGGEITLRSVLAFAGRSSGWVLRVLVPALLKLSIFLITFGLVAVFGAIQDRPSNVYEHDKENRFSHRNQWVSTVFYAVVALAAVLVAGPFGFVPLAFAVLVVARRRSAMKFVPYAVSDLVDNIAEVLEKKRHKITVMVIMGITALLYSLRMLTVPLAGTDSIAAVLTFALWLVITFKAANKNLAVGQKKAALITTVIAFLSKAFGGTTDDWRKANIELDGPDIVVTKFPIGAVLKYDGANEDLEKMTQDWELDPASDEKQLTLHPVSQMTRDSRKARAESGGYIDALIETEQTPEAPAFADFTITDDDLANHR